MRISHTPEAEELREVVRDFLERQAGDPAAWTRLATELGAVALDVPERLGGAGATFREVCVVAEELGRSLARLPWFGTSVLAVGALLAGRGSARDELLARLASGSCTATVAFVDDSEDTVAVAAGAGWRVSGSKTLVVDGASADVLLVTARTGEGTGLFAVDGAGLDREPLRALDPNRELATIRFRDAPATLVEAEAEPVTASVRNRAVAALACEQAGGATVALEMACAHAAQRVQFGRPIATFQAIKHRCADMAVRVEAARSASLWAAAAVADGATEAAQAAAVAALTCGEAYSWVAAENIQVHGGMGFTWEHPAHLHLRRATTSAVLFGDRLRHQEDLLASLGLPETGRSGSCESQPTRAGAAAAVRVP
ncbi:acyl-CoA dehydrogenase family protein [Amycolatopsis endophytica]|uniref:Alkylation response protein AidB-like acyl-CoA dehydrogenase n=1 Tax=Amycolatopsis endophytica TaxID=860233 RepID=A0A853BC54_9PSEU|nr:acyl-CoA dehydrogenase family protein [Amycolatopsis endophytica]NYI92251.1 alkylation response protein AidB-like acyl-CoA dehydrogenase [Amycolatopsis endophytica]